MEHEEMLSQGREVSQNTGLVEKRADVTEADRNQSLRGDIESRFARERDRLEKERIAQHEQVDEGFREAMANLERTRQSELVSAGLNPDGSHPRDRQQGSPR